MPKAVKAPAKAKKVLVEEPIEEVTKPVEAEEVVEVAKPVAEKTADALVGKKLGALEIVKSSDVTINGKELKRLMLSDRTETILSEKDLKEFGVI